MSLTAADYTVGWISALPDEVAAAEGMFDEEHECLDIPNQDTNSYSYGRIGSHNIVLACLPSAGTAAAATLATHMARTFPNLRFGLMVGVGGGIPHLEAGPENDIRLGDIVVSTPHAGYGGVIQYDYGKTIQHKDFTHTGSLNRPPAILSTAITRFRGKARRRGYGFPAHIRKMLDENPAMDGIFSSPGAANDHLFDVHCLHYANKSDCSACQGKIPRQSRRDPSTSVVHYGLIGSANQVMRDASIRDKIGNEMAILCLEMEAGGLMNDFPCVVIRGICDYCDTHKNKTWQPYAATVAAAYTKELLEHISRPQVSGIQKAADVMIELTKCSAILKETTSKLNTLQHNIDINGLPCVEGAGFNWASGSADNRCHPSTRVELLGQIRNWFEDPKSESIYWLNGMAGTGKTTIAREICYHFTENNELAASFFFKKGEGDRGNAAKFCPTIAIQLIQSVKGFDTALAEMLRESRDAIRLTFQEQFEKFIGQPLSRVEQGQKMLIVVDALDECANEQDVKRLLILFSKLNSYTDLRLKIFVTGRPELYVRLGFARIQTEHVTFKLHNVDQAIVEHDIEAYMNTELVRIREEYNLIPIGSQALSEQWPGTKRLKRLLRVASPLFIYAATICRFIGSSNPIDPEGKLERMLVSRQSHGMESIYLPILEQLLQDCDISERSSQIQEFNQIIGPLVILFEPLTVHVFAEVLDVNCRRVESLLHTLHSVLMVPDHIDTPVQLLHLSFRDFLVDLKRQGREFAIDEGTVQVNLMEQCVILLGASGYLRQNICELEHPGSRCSEVSANKLNQNLPPGIQYACVYWLQHFEARQGRSFNADIILSFLEEHFLHWLEALSLLGHITEAANTLRRLVQNAQLSGHNQLYQFLKDAERFLGMFGGIIIDYPLQLYSSALIFAPEFSLVVKNFERNVPSYFVPTSTKGKEWATEHLPIEAPGDKIVAVAISPDEGYLATASSLGSIKIWNLSLGSITTTAHTHGQKVWAITFSLDGSVIACGCATRIVQLYETASGIPLVTIQAQCEVSSIAFSNNSELIALGLVVGKALDPLISLWHCRSGDSFQDYVGDALTPHYLAFSRQDTILAAGGRYGISLWDVARGTQIKSFDAWLLAMTALPSSDTIFFTAKDFPQTHIYAIDMVDQSMQKLSDPKTGITRVIGERKLFAMAPTGDLFALASGEQGVVQLWNTSHKVQIALFRPHVSQVGALYFSSSDYLVTVASEGSAKGDRMVKVWKISDLLEMASKTPQGTISKAGIALSGDGKKCAWLYDHKYIQIWNIQKKIVAVNIEVEVKCSAIKLSYHGKYLAQYIAGQVRICKLSPEAGLVKWTLPCQSVKVFAFSHIDHIIAVGTWNEVQLWDLSKRSCLKQWTHAEADDIHFLPKGRHLAWCHNGYTTVVNLYSDEKIFFGTGSDNCSLVFDNDEKYIVIAGLQYSNYGTWGRYMVLHLFDVSSGKKLETINTGISAEYFPSGVAKPMSFDRTGTTLQTSFGVFTFKSLKSRMSLASSLETETLCIEGEWIKLGERNFLWIPTTYRSSTWISTGRSLALLSPDGALFVFNLDADTDQDEHGNREP